MTQNVLLSMTLVYIRSCRVGCAKVLTLQRRAAVFFSPNIERQLVRPRSWEISSSVNQVLNKIVRIMKLVAFKRAIAEF